MDDKGISHWPMWCRHSADGWGDGLMYDFSRSLANRGLERNQRKYDISSSLANRIATTLHSMCLL